MKWEKNFRCKNQVYIRNLWSEQPSAPLAEDAITGLEFLADLPMWYLVGQQDEKTKYMCQKRTFFERLSNYTNFRFRRELFVCLIGWGLFNSIKCPDEMEIDTICACYVNCLKGHHLAHIWTMFWVLMSIPLAWHIYSFFKRAKYPSEKQFFFSYHQIVNVPLLLK